MKEEYRHQPGARTSRQHNHFVEILEGLNLPISYREVEDGAFGTPHLIFRELEGERCNALKYSVCILRRQSQQALDIRLAVTLWRNGYSWEKIAEFPIERTGVHCIVSLVEGPVNMNEGHTRNVPFQRNQYFDRRAAS